MPRLPDSWYKESAHPFPALPALAGDIEADVVILGAGITGLSTAIELAERGYRVVVLEASRVGFGASGRSGGQIIFGYGCEQAKLRRLLGEEAARRLFRWSVEGVELIDQRVAKYAIDCDLSRGHAHAAIRPRQVEELRRFQAELNDLDYPGTELWTQNELRQRMASQRYRALLYDPRSGHLHPLNYTLGLARAAQSLGVRLFEESAVTAIERTDPVVFHTARGRVRAGFGVIAGNAWLRGIAPELEARIMPVGTYIAASEVLGAKRAQALIQNAMAVADINFVLDYFRLSSDHRLLFGGRVSYSKLAPPGLKARMRSRMLAVFPQLTDVKIASAWGGYVDISMNRAPDWGRLTPNLYYAQGFSGHGIAATGLAGRVIAEAIAGQSERLDCYARIRHRPFPGGPWLRTPALVLAMAWFRLLDLRP